MDTLPALETHSLFQGLPAPVLSAVAAAAESVRFSVGAVLFRHGAPSESMLVILSGLAAITPAEPWSSGQEAVAWVRDGESVGELGVLTGRARSATVTAASAVSALRLPAETVRSLMLAHPALAVHLATVLADRLEESLVQRVAARRRARIVALMVAEGEDGRPLADALARGGAGAGYTLSTASLRTESAEGPAALARMAQLVRMLENFQANADLAVVVHPIEAAALYTRPLLARASMVLLSPGAGSVRQRAALRALAGPGRLSATSVTLSVDDAPGLLAQLRGEEAA